MIAMDAIHRLSLKEKLLVIEALWEDISREEAGPTVPEWHGEVLIEREAQVAAGMSNFLDWEDAKREIRDALR